MLTLDFPDYLKTCQKAQLRFFQDQIARPSQNPLIVEKNARKSGPGPAMDLAGGFADASVVSMARPQRQRSGGAIDNQSFNPNEGMMQGTEMSKFQTLSPPLNYGEEPIPVDEDQNSRPMRKHQTSQPAKPV